MRNLMKRTWVGITGFVVIIFCLVSCSEEKSQTKVSIHGNAFHINGKITYQDRYFQGKKIEGLLFNSRMVQGIFDDLNPETRDRFKYPDTGIWDPVRNTREFVEAMESWYEHGLLSFTLNLQGGSPMGYGNHGWRNSAFDEDGELRSEYMKRLCMILDRADELGMVPIIGLFYFGQDQYLKNESAVFNAVDNVCEWLIDKNYKNLLIEVNNECNVQYDHEILKPQRVHELIERVQSTSEKAGHRFLVSTSYGGGTIPGEKVLEVSDFVLLHGNGVNDPEGIAQMVQKVRELKSYIPKPIVFNEDDHFDFGEDSNNFLMAVGSYASWGFFDYRMKGEGYEAGYQSVPVDWGIHSDRKAGFFKKLKEVTGFN